MNFFRDVDVALLVLDSRSDAQPVELAKSDKCFTGRGGCVVQLLGWGEGRIIGKLTENLRQAFTLSVGKRDCENDLRQVLPRHMICAGEFRGGIDSCDGDSGGPMLLDTKQIGIVSWGGKCAKKRSPGVYISIPRIRGWIDGELAQIAASKEESGQ